MPGAAATQPVTGAAEHEGLVVLEKLARAARQISLYGPEHAMAAEALTAARDGLAEAAEEGPVEVLVTEEGLLWNRSPVPAGSALLQRLHMTLRERLVAALRFTPHLEPPDLVRLLLLLAEDAVQVLASGGVMRVFVCESAGIVVEDIDFSQEMRECEAAWVKQCAEVDPEAAETLRELLQSCLRIVRTSRRERSLKPLREALAARPAVTDEPVEPADAIAGAAASLIQSAGEVILEEEEEARRESWGASLLGHLEALGPQWTARIFRAPAPGGLGGPDVLAVLARRMSVEQCVSIVLDYPGGIATERSAGLSLALRRVFDDTSRSTQTESALHAEALARGITEEVYRNVVGVLTAALSAEAREYLPWRLLDGGEETLRHSNPAVALGDLLETTTPRAAQRSHAFTLLDLLDHTTNPQQGGALVRRLVGTIAHCSETHELELLADLLEGLREEAAADRAGPSAMAASALAAASGRDLVASLAQEAARGPAADRPRLMALLGSLGPEGREALAAIARHTYDAEWEDALRALLPCDGPEFGQVRHLLMDLPLPGLTAALRIVLASDDPQLVSQVRVLASHQEPEFRLSLVRAVEEAGKPAAGLVVIRLLNDPLPALRAAAAALLGRLRVGEAVPALCYTLERESAFGRGAEVQAAIAHALGQIGSPEAVPRLAAVLLRRGLAAWFAPKRAGLAAAEALGRIGGADARQVLERGAQELPAPLAPACQHALTQLGGGHDG
jgi:HEAT repeat protein